MKQLYAVLGSLLTAVLLMGAGCTGSTANTNTTAQTNTANTNQEVEEDGLVTNDDEDSEEDIEDAMEAEEEDGDDEDATEDDATEDDDDTAEAATTVTVSTVGNSFTPEELVINAGDSVEFSLGATHNAVEVSESDYSANKSTAKSGGFSVGFGGSETVTFDEPGTYYYVCAPHVALGMKGTITVQ